MKSFGISFDSEIDNLKMILLHIQITRIVCVSQISRSKEEKHFQQYLLYLLSMSASIVSTSRANTGSHNPTTASGVERQPECTTPPNLFGFVTPTEFVARHKFWTSLESPPRKKHRSNLSSSVDDQRIATSTSAGPSVSHLDSLHDDASILARLHFSTVPNNEFILARPNQVSNSFEIKNQTYIERPRTGSISTNDADADTDPVADSNDIFGFLEDEHRDSPRPPSAGRNPTMTTIPGMFLPINVQHLAASFSELHMTNTRGFGLRLKPRPRKRTAHWDPEFTF
jgi:hypothetical protein